MPAVRAAALGVTSVVVVFLVSLGPLRSRRYRWVAHRLLQESVPCSTRGLAYAVWSGQRGTGSHDRI